MHVEYEKKEKKLLFKIDEEIDHYNCEKIKKRADYEIEIHIPKKVIFDLENVTFMDSSGIGMLIGRYKLEAMLGRKNRYNKCKSSCKKSIRNEWSSKINTNRKYRRDMPWKKNMKMKWS